MIRLRDLLAEITLGSVTPYATQFVWGDEFSPNSLQTQFTADGHRVIFNMMPIGHNEWIFTMLTDAKDDTMPGNLTTSHQRSVAAGNISYLRLMRTAAEAIIDFCAAHSPEAVDVSGGDSDTEKAIQKTRIYQGFIQSNASRLAAAGYGTLNRNGKLYIVRRSNADATGIENG
jgi:hypothetical protein